MTEEAMTNFEALGKNPYPGRGLVVGRNEDGSVIQIYWIMGRSENSRNRVFEKDRWRVFTTPADPSKVDDPSLIIYNAMDESQDGNLCVVSNGHQTDDIVKPHPDESLCNILGNWSYEPDEPNFTPRITGVYRSGDWPSFELAIIRSRSFFQKLPERFYYQYEDLMPGIGMCLTTYRGDGTPLPHFVGEPLLMPIKGETIEEIGLKYWNQLNEANRISIAVKLISGPDSEVFIKNRYAKV